MKGIQKGTNADLWHGLQFCVPTGNWRAAQDKRGLIVASTVKSKDAQELEGEVASGGGVIFKNIITTAFDGEKWDELAVCPHYATGTSVMEVTTSTTTTTRSGFVFQHDPVATPLRVEETPTVMETTVATDDTSYHVHVQTSRTIPKYTKEELNTMKVEDLKNLCCLYNIKHGKVKGDYVENIFLRSQAHHNTNSPVKKLVHLLQSAWLPQMAPAHNVYRAEFNTVDLADRRYKSVDHSHRIEDWKVKFTFILLRYATINGFSTFAATNAVKYSEYRPKLAEQLFAHGCK